MQEIATGLQIAGGVAGILSAYFWWRAAVTQPTPPYLGGSYLMDKPPDRDTPWKRAWDRSTHLNATAAILTGIGALFEGIGTILSVHIQ